MSGPHTETMSNRVTEKSATGKTLWLVSAEWRGGHDKRKILLEDIYRDEASAQKRWSDLTPENHNLKHSLEKGHDAGFKRHPIRVYRQEE